MAVLQTSWQVAPGAHWSGCEGISRRRNCDEKRLAHRSAALFLDLRYLTSIGRSRESVVTARLPPGLAPYL
eukprot:7429795-Pyramimonas_sp.AAC.2